MKTGVYGWLMDAVDVDVDVDVRLLISEHATRDVERRLVVVVKTG